MSDKSSQKEKSEKEECEILRKFILSCPNVSKDGRAMRSALKGLEEEKKRIDRDAKLKRKFIEDDTSCVLVDKTQTSLSSDASAPIFVPTATSPPSEKVTSSLADSYELMEWQDVDADSKQEKESLLGGRLAQASVELMSKYSIKVSSPLAALALAFHSCLCSQILGFACTGIPEKPNQKPSGFAAPIRELPKTQLVPAQWDKDSNEVRLRYRKASVGSVSLVVSLENNTVLVVFCPSSCREPPNQTLTFPMEDHLNLDSFAKASQKEGRILPALHFKSLPHLLTQFCNMFDLGNIQENGDTSSNSTPQEEKLPYVDSTIVSSRLSTPQSSDPLRLPTRPIPAAVPRDGRSFGNPFEVQVYNPHRGDFAGDVAPPGHVPFPGDGGGPGNLMGPNHSIFQGGRIIGHDGIGVGGNAGMQPRFDPIGPPGGPQDPNGLRFPQRFPQRKPPPGGFGDPNHDHMRPPSDLNNNMFS